MEKLFRIAILLIAPAYLAGCTTLDATQADFWADKAEEIARDCPAASTQARTARAAAAGAAAQSTAPADAASARAVARDELVRNLAQARAAWDNASATIDAANSQNLANCLALPTSSPTIGGGNVNPRENRINQMEQEQAECGQRAACLERGNTSAECGVNACFGLDAETCRLRERWAVQEANFCRRGQPLDEDTIKSHQDAARQASRALGEATNALAEFDQETSRLSATEGGQGTLVPGQATMVTSYPEQAQTAYLEAQRIAAEQCGEGATGANTPPIPAPIPGSYPQDVYDSQAIPLRSSSPGGPACCSTDSSCAICTGVCPAFCSICNTGC